MAINKALQKSASRKLVRKKVAPNKKTYLYYKIAICIYINNEMVIEKSNNIDHQYGHLFFNIKNCKIK